MSVAELTFPTPCPAQEHRSELLKWMATNAVNHPVLRRIETVSSFAGCKLIVVAPRQCRHGLWFLFKSGSEVLTEEEVEWKAYLDMAHYEVHVVREWTAAARIVVAYLNLTIESLVVGLPHSSAAVDEYRRRRTR